MFVLLALSACSGTLGVDEADRLDVSYFHGNAEEDLPVEIWVDADSCDSFVGLESSTLAGVSPSRVATVPNEKIPGRMTEFGWNPGRTECGFSKLFFDLSEQDLETTQAELLLSGVESDVSLELTGKPFQYLEVILPDNMQWTEPWTEPIGIQLSQEIVDTTYGYVNAETTDAATRELLRYDSLSWTLDGTTLWVDLGGAQEQGEQMQITELEISGFAIAEISCPQGVRCDIWSEYVVVTP